MKNRVAGFTLVEVLVALGVLALVTSAVAPSFLRFMHYNTRTEIKTEAIQAAQRVLDELRLSDPRTLPTSGSTPSETVMVGGRSYDVTVSYCENATYCPSENTRHLTVDVVYKGEQVYEVETVYTRLR
ncbi:MAG: type II secretion system protein [Deltaproteobacteria bacterium]|nr:type II secretion system protein [Deltaproteobacteria bacterium]